MATITDVAERAGVSTTTVSHVINRSRHVSDETRRRVEEAMAALHYRPNSLARSLRQGQSQTLGLIIPDSANPFFAEIGRTIEMSAFALGYSVIFCNTEGNLEREKFYTEVLEKKQVDGMIFVAAAENTEALRGLLVRGMPVVVIDRDLPDVETDTVLTNNRQGGYLATRHLLAHGHRRIACIGGPVNVHVTIQRVIGYRNALQEAGLPVDEQLIRYGDFHPESGRSLAAALLSSGEPPNGIFACNDLMALGVLRAAAERSLRLPQDLAVVGFDDIELSAFMSPALSTIAQPKAELGRRAVEMLIERIRDRTRPPRREILPMRLIARESSGERL